MAKERLIGRDKHPFVLFSSVCADPLRRIHPSGKYTVIAKLKIFNKEVYILFFLPFHVFDYQFDLKCYKFDLCCKVST